MDTYVESILNHITRARLHPRYCLMTVKPAATELTQPERTFRKHDLRAAFSLVLKTSRSLHIFVQKNSVSASKTSRSHPTLVSAHLQVAPPNTS